jgi:hypothetical protein
VKQNQLLSVAHSLADSLGSGISLMTGCYELGLYGDAALSPENRVSIDLLNGKIIGGSPSQSLLVAVQRIPREFERLCNAAGFSMDNCRRAEAQFFSGPTRFGSCFSLKTVQDN